MNESLMLWINQGWAHPLLDPFFTWVSAKAAFALPLVLLISAYLGRRFGADGWRLALSMVLLIACGDLLGNFLKHMIGDPRPCFDFFEQLRRPASSRVRCASSSDGMPSNHALNYFAVAVFISYMLQSWRWRLAMFMIAATVAISRVYLGSHYPDQVAMGILIGSVYSALATRWLCRRFEFARRIVTQTKS